MERMMDSALLLWISVLCAIQVGPFSLQFAASEFASVEGDISIAGLFEIQTRDGGRCGATNVDSVMVLEATRWYIEQLNKNNSLPFKIGFKGYKTCGLPNIAVDQTLDILGDHRSINNTEDSEDIFVGIIGPAKSEEAKKVVSILSSRTEENRLLQISVSATASTLGDKHLYPSFYRVIPDDSKQIQTMLLLMQQLGWNRIAIVYENDTYGRDGAMSLDVLVQQHLICVSKMLAISVSDDGDVSLDQINAVLTEIMLQPPVIGGVVLFASKTVANKVLIAVDNRGVVNVPLFLLSESIGLQDDVFRSSGVILEKTKGSISVSAPFTEITSFTDHWLSLFTDMTLLEETAAVNPWLKDVLVAITDCDKISSCSDLTLQEAANKFPVQPVYLKYAILAAHTMSKALLQVYNNLCAGPPGDCLSDFTNKFQPNMMIKEMNGLSINFGSDFQPGISVQPLAGAEYQIKFGNASEPYFRSDHELYQVYNYRRRPSGNKNDFGFLKVGSLTDNLELNLDINALRDYDQSENEKVFPNIRKGQCPVGERCSECIRPDVPELLLHVPGDLYVVGIAPINNKAIPGPLGCGSVRTANGYQLALSMQYGVQTFNSSSQYAEYRSKFGDKQIGLIVLNSCNNDLSIVGKVLNLHNRMGVTLNNGEFLDLTDKILGYIGSFSSGVSLAVATQLTKIGKVQVSYSSTNPVLSDEKKYPYFMRIVTPDNVQAEAMMEVVKSLKGEYIQVVHNEGSYGIGGRDSVTSSAKSRGICIAQYIEVKESDRYYEYYDLIRREPHAKIVIIFLNSHVLAGFMRDLNEQMTELEFQFIGSEAWGKNVEYLQYPITKGALTVTLEMDGIRGLTTFIQEKVPEKDTSDIWLEQYIQNRQNCYFEWSYDKVLSRQCTDDILPPAEKANFHTDSWCNFAATALLSLLMGSADLFAKSCGNSAKLCQEFMNNPSDLVEEMKKISMDLYGTGAIQIFDSVGDGNMGYQIYNVKEDQSDTDELTYARVGRFNLKTGLDINPSNIGYPTREKIVSSCPNEQACKDCFETSTTEPTPSEATSDGATIGLGVVTGILGLAVIVLAVIIILLKRRPQKEDPYIHPSGDLVRPEAVGKLDSPYHSHEMIEETKY